MKTSTIIGIVAANRESSQCALLLHFPLFTSNSPFSLLSLGSMILSQAPSNTNISNARYRDVVIRLEPIIMELERSENILIVTHQAVLRCIYAYFMKKNQSSSPWLNVPLHTLIKLTPRAYGTQEEVYVAGIKAVSTWRGKGSVAQHEDPADTTESLGKKDQVEATAAAA